MWIVQQDNDSQSQQQIYNIQTLQEKNRGVAMAKSKPRPD